MTAPLTPEDIKAQYGFVAMLAEQVPEIGSLMQQAVAGKWTADRFSMAVASTNWWRTTDPATRSWITTQASDPAGAESALRDGGAQFASQAAGLGFYQDVFSVRDAQQAWLYSKLHGFNDTQSRAYIASIAGPRATQSGVAAGEFGKWMTDVRSLGQAYGFPADRTEQEIQNNAVTAWAGGTGDINGVRQKMMNYAASKYAPFADRIQAGETVRDIAQPYIDVYAQTLEVNPQDVGLDDNYIQRWLQGRTEAGKPPAAAPVWQAQQELRKDPRWQYTHNAWESMANVAHSIGRSFGMYG